MNILADKILSKEDSFRTHSYKGIGRVPKGMKPKSGANKRMKSLKHGI